MQSFTVFRRPNPEKNPTSVAEGQNCPTRAVALGRFCRSPSYLQESDGSPAANNP